MTGYDYVAMRSTYHQPEFCIEKPSKGDPRRLKEIVHRQRMDVASEHTIADAKTSSETSVPSALGWCGSRRGTVGFLEHVRT